MISGVEYEIIEQYLMSDDLIRLLQQIGRKPNRSELERHNSLAHKTDKILWRESGKCGNCGGRIKRSDTYCGPCDNGITEEYQATLEGFEVSCGTGESGIPADVSR